MTKRSRDSFRYGPFLRYRPHSPAAAQLHAEAAAQQPHPSTARCHPSATNNTTNPRLKPHNHPVSTKPGQLQTDPDLAVYDSRDDAEAAIAGLKYQAGRRLRTLGDDNLTLNIVTYQMLQLAAV